MYYNYYFYFKQKLRLLEELEDTWLPYLTPKDDEFYQQVIHFNVLSFCSGVFDFPSFTCKSSGLVRLNKR